MYRQLLFCGKGEGFVAGCSQAEEISRKEKGGGEGGGRKGRGRSPLQYALEKDEISAHRRKPRKGSRRNREKKWGKSCRISLFNYRRRRLWKRRKRTQRLKKKKGE